MQHQKSIQLPFSSRSVFEWYGRVGSLQRLLPPWDGASLICEDAPFEVGKRFELRLGPRWAVERWQGQYRAIGPGESFSDVQVKGPFGSWTHRVEVAFLAERQCRVTETVECAPSARQAKDRHWEANTSRWLEGWLGYRQETLAADLGFRERLGDFERLRVLITGGTGFLGSRLKAFLSAQGHEVLVLTRRKPGPGEIRWKPELGEIEVRRLEGLDAVVHLAGESLTSGRWSEQRKKVLWSSRVDATKFLVEALARLAKPPRLLLSGSGIGYYGSLGDTVCDEGTGRGSGFLAELCEAWEAAALKAAPFVERVALLRTGVVIDPAGGALAEMLPAFRWGLGGPIGGGRQWFPWIALDDWLRAVTWCLFRRRAEGPVNLVAPDAARQERFAKALGAALGRPACLPVPKFGLRALFGEMADEALLSSIRAEPKRLAALDYRFRYPELEPMLAGCFARDLR